MSETVQLRKFLLQIENEIELGRRHIRLGGAAVDLPSVAGVPTVNPAFNAHIKRVQDARRRAQVAYFTMAMQEGLSHRRIGQLWGVSRQRVSMILSRRAA